MDKTTIDNTTIGIAIGIIQLSIIVIQLYCRSKVGKEFRTILSTIWRKAKKIESKVSDLEGAAASELVSGHVSIESNASAIVNDIDEFRRIHWKEEPPRSS